MAKRHTISFWSSSESAGLSRSAVGLNGVYRPEIAQEPPSAISISYGFHLLARTFPFLLDPKFSTPPATGLPRDRVWRGLARYRTAEEDASRVPRREEREYAKVTTLLESPALDLTYYSDAPGESSYGSVN